MLRDPNYKSFRDPLTARKRGACKAGPGLFQKMRKRRFQCDLVTENELEGDSLGLRREAGSWTPYFWQLILGGDYLSPAAIAFVRDPLASSSFSAQT